MSKETFKEFARSHPELASQVMNGKTSWQRLYELFEIYGENNQVWNEYIPTRNISTSDTSTYTSPASTFKDFFNTFKNLDLDSVQKGVANIQKTIGLLQDIGLGTSSTPKTQTYEPRPMYKYFED